MREEEMRKQTTNKSLKFCCLEKQRHRSVAEGMHDIKEPLKMEPQRHVGVLMSVTQQRVSDNP